MAPRAQAMAPRAQREQEGGALGGEGHREEEGAQGGGGGRRRGRGTGGGGSTGRGSGVLDPGERSNVQVKFMPKEEVSFKEM